MYSEDAAAVVYRLNSICADQTQSSNMTLRPFHLLTDGEAQKIKFLDQSIWDSEEDERDTPDGVPEELETFLRRETQSLLDTIKLINLNPNP